MKQCPECDENLADDAVHCGHCGAKVEEDDGGRDKKTMFGLGTVSEEELEQAAEQAREASGSDDEPEEDERASESGSSRLPRPGASGSDGGGEEGEAGQETSEGGTRLGLTSPAGGESETPGLAKTEAMSSGDDENEPAAADTAPETSLRGPQATTEPTDNPPGATAGGDDIGTRETLGVDGPSELGEPPETNEPVGGSASSRRASASEADTSPPDEEANAELTDDDRFSVDIQQEAGPGRQQAGGTDDGIDKKTLFIVAGVLVASGLLCGAAVVVGWIWMM